MGTIFQGGDTIINHKFEEYFEFTKKLEKATNGIHLASSIKTKRKGAGGIRDKIVFYKQAWAIAETWAGLPKTLVYWLALTPLAIISYNSFIELIGLESITVPLE